jgi:D-3-phosphoglycerate dehydrogenase
VLCAGDGFISAELLAGSVAKQIGRDHTYVLHQSIWPFEPSRNSDDVSEWSGDPIEIAELATNAEILVTHHAPVGRFLLDKATRLELVGCCRGGAANVNVPLAAERGITVVNSPGRNAQATAEFTIGLLISGLRGIVEGSSTMRAGTWDRRYYNFSDAGSELGGKTVGLVGLGQVGRKVATILSAIGASVLVYDPYVSNGDIQSAGAKPSSLGELLSGSDVVSLHARLTRETRNLVDSEALGAMKSGAYVVNTARGGLLDYDALVRQIKSGHISGAALDVFPEEPLPLDHELWRLPQVTMTPHIAGASKEAALRGANEVAEDVGRYCRGEPLSHAISGSTRQATTLGPGRQVEAPG